MKKRMRDLSRLYPGFDVSKTNGGHYRLRCKVSGKVLFTPSTPSDWRDERNLSTKVRRVMRSGL